MMRLKKFTGLFFGLLLTQLLSAQEANIGDIVEMKDGSKGIVFYTFSDGTGGWAAALRDYEQAVLCAPADIPSALPRHQTNILGWFDDTAGYTNTGILRTAAGAVSSAYAVGAVDYENGWYVPAAKQLYQFIAAIPYIKESLLAHGGDLMLPGDYYWSSTVLSDGNVLIFNDRNMTTSFITWKTYVRPVCTFRTTPLLYDSTLTYRWSTGAETVGTTDYPLITTDYTVSVANADRCGTSDHHRVLVASATPQEIFDTICFGERYQQNGFDTDVPGDHTETITGAGGCTTQLTLHLAVMRDTTLYFSGRICEGEVYSLHNFSETLPGAYTQRWERTAGCDSTVVLDLEVVPVRGEVRDTVCEGSDYTKHGFALPGVTAGGVHSLHIPRTGLCDSVLSLSLHVNPLKRRSNSVRTCTGSSYTGYGFSLPAPLHADTTCLHRIVNPSGCDSLVTLTLRVDPLPETRLFDTICAGDPYVENPADPFGFDLPAQFRDTVYTKTVTTAGGCDSVIYLELAVSPPATTDTFRDMVLYGEDYTGYGFTLTHVTRDSLYRDTVRSVLGCDSLVTILELTVLRNVATDLYDTVCFGDFYGGSGFALPPVYRDTVCVATFPLTPLIDSTVILHLTVVPRYNFLYGAEVCAGSDYTGYGFTLFDIISDTVCLKILSSVHGCDSIVQLYVKVLPDYTFRADTTVCPGERVEFRGRWLDRPGDYTDSLKTAAGCDSLYLFTLSWHPVLSTQDTVALCMGDTLTWYGVQITTPGIHSVHLLSATGCVETPTLVVYAAYHFNGDPEIRTEDCATYTYRFAPSGNTNDLGTDPVYRWDFGDGSGSDEEEPVHSYADSGRYRVSLQVFSAGSCDTTLYREVTVAYYPEHLGIYSDRTTATYLDPEIRFRTDDVPGVVYEWDFGDGGRGTGAEVAHLYDVSVSRSYTVVLRAYNLDSCVVERSMEIFTDGGLRIPNTFSPNEDGVNDRFMPGFRVKIVNRNGWVLYEGSDGWDGKYREKEAPEDTYFYELHYTEEYFTLDVRPDREKTIKGYLRLVR